MAIQSILRWRSGLAALSIAACMAASAKGQSPVQKLEGMWSDPPKTAVGQLCFFWCTDVGIARINKLLDDPANDARRYSDLLAETQKYQLDTYIKPKLINEAARQFPLNPLEDPSYVRCEPYGFAQQIVAAHQLEIRQRGNSRIEMHYGEWDAHRMIDMDGHAQTGNMKPSLLGHSAGHWEGSTLVIETSGIRANRMFGAAGAPHTDQLHVVERYTRSEDGKTLLMTATFEDPQSLKEPVVLKKIWTWSPQSEIAPYKDCERPTDTKKGANHP